MTKNEFEKILDVCCEQLTHEAREEKFKTSSQFENRAREALSILTENDPSFEIDFPPIRRHSRTSLWASMAWK